MYQQRLIFTGPKIIEVEKVHTSRCKGKRKRSPNHKPTPEAIQKQNLKLANDHLRQILNTNFRENDLHIILTYNPKFKTDMSNVSKHRTYFINKLRREFRKLGKELQYIYVTGNVDKDYDDEERKKYKHNDTAMHHHFIIKDIDYKIITGIWKKFGRVLFYPLDDGDLTALANYFVEHTKNNFRDANSSLKKKWSCSRNLKKPIIKKKRIKADSWTEHPKPFKGYMIITDSVRYGVSEITGYPYQYYRMIKIQC